MNEDKYIYVSAKIKVLELKILDMTDIERIIDAPDFISAFKVLNDTDYRDNLLDVAPDNYKKAISQDTAQLHDFLQKNTPDKNLFSLMMLPRDFINLKLLFKARQFGVDVKEQVKTNVIYKEHRAKDLPFENCANSPEAIEAYIKEQKWQTLSEEIKETIVKVIKEIDGEVKPDKVDSILTQHYFDLSLKLSQRIKSDLIIQYVKASIDSANLLTWIRAKKMGLSKDFLKEKIIRNGHTDTAKMIGFYPDDLAGLKTFINITFNNDVVKAYNEFCEDNKVFKIEKAVEDYKNDFIKKFRSFGYGPEVVFGYYLAKTNENINANIVLTGKLNNISNSKIRETVRAANTRKIN